MKARQSDAQQLKGGEYMGALFLLIALLLALGVVYPVSAVILYRLSGSKKTIIQILSEL